MIQITYISRATAPMSAENLLALLQQCLPNNASRSVTGMLLYGNDTFLQVLEGDEQVVENLFDTIGKDTRHTDIQLLRRRPIESRQYSDWSMGFKRISGQDLQNIDGLRNFGESDFNFDYLVQHDNIVEALMDHYRTPYWDPLVRELDAKEKVVEHLRKALASSRSSVEIASLILESVIDASRKGSLSEAHLRLCESALSSLKARPQA
jgi:hypothetical protein